MMMRKCLSTRNLSQAFVHMVYVLMIGCGLPVFVFTGCSQNDDYEIYATLYGTITDYETGIPLENVNVVLPPSSLTVRTGTDGTFAFDNLDAQLYTITVQKSGYQPNRKTVTAISGERMEVNIPMTKIEP